MEIIVENMIIVKNPTKEMKNWCKRELVIDNPEYSKKERMGFWTGNTPRKLSFYEKNGADLLLPYGTFTSIPDEILNQAERIYSHFPDYAKCDYGQTDMHLYDYQEKAVDMMAKAGYGILQSEAGSGKTQMGIALTKKLNSKTLWLTHTLDLLKQSKDRAKQYISENLIGEISGGQINIGQGITFATIQTMNNLDLPKYRDVWETIIVDECHHVAGTPTTLTMFSKVLNNLRAAHKYGLSATVHRADGLIKATYSLLGPIVYIVPKEALKGHIMQVGVHPIESSTKITNECLNYDGTINYQRMINYLVDNKARCENLAKLVYQVGNHFQTLVLSARKRFPKNICAFLPIDFVSDNVFYIDAGVPKDTRKEILNQLRERNKPYVLFATYQLAKEGLDIPKLERLILGTPESDYTIIGQSLGRIARVADGKKKPVVLDIVDNGFYFEKSYKKRKTTYRKKGCYFI